MSHAVIIPLDAASIRNALPDPLQGLLKHIHIFETIDSTSEWLLKQEQACRELCLAEKQTAGRGRRGRSWHSPPGNILFSLRWCFDSIPPHYSWLGLVTGVAVAKGLADYGLSGHGLKWPNDIHHNGRKLCGILLQTAQPVQQVIVSFGMNICPHAADSEENPVHINQAWCDLNSLLGQTVDRNRLIAIILGHLLTALSEFPQFNRQAFLTEWHTWDLLYQRPVNIDTGTELLQGTTIGLDEQGRLQVRLNDGRLQSYSSADISVRYMQ
ncbi:MAG: biotin--[acetyl-CoA-carboxylase] ligase [Proteobacteria bacterium]|nr:MAG: biotin--[acetyl-CoA-carboxylase] ligase [Pseudomonadota bacterium]